MQKMRIRTDWLGLLLSLLVPSALVAGLLWAATRTWDDTPIWSWGLFALIPVEGLRLFVMVLARDAYRTYNGPWQAMMSFINTVVLAFGFIVVCMLLPGKHGGVFGNARSTVEALSSPLFWQVILVPIGLTVAEGALGLLLFRGDARRQAAYLDAIGTTSAFWFMFGLIYPALFGMPVFVALVLFSQKFADLFFAHLHELLFGYAAFYFAVKAVLISFLYTARFLRTCRCPVFGENPESIEERRAAFFGEGITLSEIMAQTARTARNKPLGTDRPS